MNCQICGCEIPAARLEALPYATKCVKCSDAKPLVGFMDWNHKTAPELVLVDSGNAENLRRAKRINQRAR